MFSLRRGYLRRAALTDELVFTADLPGTPHTPMFLDLKQFTQWPRSNPTPGYFPKWELFFPCPRPPISAEMFPAASDTAAANWKQTRVRRQRGCAERKMALRWQQLRAHMCMDRMPSKRTQARGLCASSSGSPGTHLSRQIEKGGHCRAVLLGWGSRGPASWGVTDSPCLDLGRVDLGLCRSKCSQIFVLFALCCLYGLPSFKRKWGGERGSVRN